MIENCDALRAFLRPGLANLVTKLAQIALIKPFLTTKHLLVLN